MPDVTRYTEALLKRGEERRRLTAQLAELVGAVANEIADTVPVGTEVAVNGKTYKVVLRRSNIGTERFLAVKVWHAEYGDDGYEIISDRAPGTFFYLHRDFRAGVQVAGRDEYLYFANHLWEIIKAFEVKEDEIIAALRGTLNRLREMAEAEDQAAGD